VEVINKTVANEIDKNLPRVKDTLLLLLSSKTFADLDSMEEKIDLKNEIVQRLNQILGKAKVVKVYFTEFVVQ
jgi:flagellar FliL protein